MNALELINFAFESDIKLSADNDNLIVDAPEGKLANEFTECLRKNKADIILALKHYGLSKAQLQDYTDEDWNDFKNNEHFLIVFADMIHERLLMEGGEIPKDFTAMTHCSCCGDVFVPPAIANNGSVLGCPWCLNKSKQLPIPHPITNN
jgi:ferritin-like protein